jgi:RecB family exonuclease
MVQEYQPRRFFRNAPNRLLQRYFAARKVLSEVDLGALTETQVEPIYEAWLKLSDDARKEMEQDFQDIDELATEGGSKAILDEARWHGEDLAERSPRSRVFTSTPSGPSWNARNTGKARWLFTTRMRCPFPIGVSARTCPASPPAWMP